MGIGKFGLPDGCKFQVTVVEEGKRYHPVRALDIGGATRSLEKL